MAAAPDQAPGEARVTSLIAAPSEGTPLPPSQPTPSVAASQVATQGQEHLHVTAVAVATQAIQAVQPHDQRRYWQQEARHAEAGAAAESPSRTQDPSE